MPTVSVVVPVLNNRERLPGLLRALKSQDRPPDEVILALACMPEATHVDRTLLEQAASPIPVRLIKNPSGTIPAGLNLGIQAARGEIIVRLDVHARPFPDHIRRCLETLAASGAEVVGGHLEIRPGAAGPVASAIALAISHPLGAGDARYRLQSPSRAGELDTVPYACFPKSLWQTLGGFNESLLFNEDYEFNWRVRAARGRVFFDPAIRTDYYARGTLGALAHQQFRYGWWKAQMLRHHPTSLRWRQGLPMTALACLVICAVAALFDPWGRFGPFGLIAAYGLILEIASIGPAVRRRSAALLLALPLAFVTVHFAWSGGAWTNLITGGRWPRPGARKEK